MSYYPQFTNLRNILANLYPDELSIRRIIDDSGIDLARVVLNSTPINNWHFVLTEVNKINKVAALIGRVDSEYGSNEAFRRACELYRRAVESPSQNNDQDYIQKVQYIFSQSPSRFGNAPLMPSLLVGREDEIHNLKTRLTASRQGSVYIQTLTVIHGWPGVGKTTIAAALVHDPDIATVFPDGVLWISLGPEPSLLSDLATWGRALGTDEISYAKSLEEARIQLSRLLRGKRVLLIVDDVWEPTHAIPFNVGGRGCATLITTRNTSVARALAPTPNDIYKLPLLTEEKSLELFQLLAPTVIDQHREKSLDLVRSLDGLPLALQLAGRVLNVESNYGFEVSELFDDLRGNVTLLKAPVPTDRTDLANETIPTVTESLLLSTSRLDKFTRRCFADLRAFAPKPFTFDLVAMKAIWQVDDPKPIVRTLVDRGLLEPVPSSNCFQIHSLLLAHAQSLLTED